MSIFREIYYRFKMTIRNKGFVFYTLLFPIVISIFYKIAFGSFIDRKIEDIEVMVEEDSFLIDVFDNMEFINLKTSSHLKKEIPNKNMDIYIDGNLDIYTNISGIKPTIIKNIVDEVKQVGKLGLTYEELDYSSNYIEEENSNSNSILIAFYSLLAMSTLQSSFAISSIAEESNANLSRVAMRKDASPAKQSGIIIGGIIYHMIFNIISNIIFILFVAKILNIEIFKNYGASLYLIVLSNFLGASLGSLIGSFDSNKFEAKEGILRGFIMLSSSFAGLIGPDLKRVIDTKAPIINMINPMDIITSNLYRANVLDNTSNFYRGTLAILFMSGVLIIFAYGNMRRKKYDSI